MKLYEPVHDRFERFCQVRCYGEMAPEDLMNETLMIAYEKLDQLQTKEAFLSFLCGISLRVLANDKRKMRPSTMRESFPDQPGYSPTDSNADSHFLYEALKLLNQDQREAIILFEITGFKIKEIAVIQECSEDSVKQRLKRGRARLKEILTYESKQLKGERHE